MAITKDFIEGLIVTIQNLYLADDIPWMIGYSGGKDSTAAVQLVWLAMEKLPREKRKKLIYIMNTDTLVESPVVSKWVKKSLDCMEKESREKSLKFITCRLEPDYDNTFWVNLIGRGYPFPRMKYRWCTDRLKIQPVNKFIKERIAEHGEVILVLGTRKQESARRNRTMTNLEKKRVRELLSPNPTLANELVFSPMEDWSDDDVWTFLMQYKNPWGYSNMDLLTMYRGATADNECPLQVDKSAPSCGKSRFGCWVCTMVEKDKSMEAMIANDQEKADRTKRYSNIALKIIERYEIELQKRKIDVLAETITNCYTKLANKKNLIKTIVMDPETLDLKYLSEEGIEIPKDSLSAGEQQLMVISILWALAICSKKKLPVIIDTPLSRLDSLHRTALITTYFPNAGEQTIILSTDSEIDENYYELMRENVGDEFTLKYDEDSKSTSIERGYLIGAKL